MVSTVTARNVRSGEHAAQLARGNRWAGLSSIGGIAGATGAMACCVFPFALFVFGISGAWIGDLTALEPYKPVFAALSLGFIGSGAYVVYWKPKAACAEGSYCARPNSTRIAKIGLWVAAAMLVVAIVFPYAAAEFLNP